MEKKGEERDVMAEEEEDGRPRRKRHFDLCFWRIGGGGGWAWTPENEWWVCVPPHPFLVLF